MGWHVKKRRPGVVKEAKPKSRASRFGKGLKGKRVTLGSFRKPNGATIFSGIRG